MLNEVNSCPFCNNPINPKDTIVNTRKGSNGRISHLHCKETFTITEASSKTTWDKFRYQSADYHPCFKCKDMMPINSLDSIKFNDLFYHKTCYEDEFMQQK